MSDGVEVAAAAAVESALGDDDVKGDDVKGVDVKGDDVKGEDVKDVDVKGDADATAGPKDGASSDDCYKYDANGMMVYTDPVSKVEYVLDPSGTKWIPRSESESKYTFDGKTYLYTDEKTGIKHRWDLEKQSWVKVSEGEQQEEKEER